VYQPEHLEPGEREQLAGIRAGCPHIDALAGHIGGPDPLERARNLPHRTAPGAPRSVAHDPVVVAAGPGPPGAAAVPFQHLRGRPALQLHQVSPGTAAVQPGMAGGRCKIHASRTRYTRPPGRTATPPRTTATVVGVIMAATQSVRGCGT
jgi:hypothetical protein